jgi:sulfoxide reductase heme-binding subunit YedZ
MLAVVHYYWLVKADVRRPIIYGAIVATLLATRVIWATQRAAARVKTPARRVPDGV